jgi:hypothetical protein
MKIKELIEVIRKVTTKTGKVIDFDSLSPEPIKGIEFDDKSFNENQIIKKFNADENADIKRFETNLKNSRHIVKNLIGIFLQPDYSIKKIKKIISSLK